MAGGTPLPFVHWTGLANGFVAPSGARLFIYSPGTTTKVTTYTDASLGTPNANPVVLNSVGQAEVWVDPTQQYKLTLAPPGTDDPPTSSYWTVDNVPAVPTSSSNLDLPVTAGENITALNAVYLSDGTGGRTAGRWYNCDPANSYSSTTPDTLGFALGTITTGNAGTARTQGIVTGLAGLTPGTTYYVNTAGALTSAAPSLARRIGVALTTTTLLLSDWLSIVAASASQAGVVSTGTQTFAGAKTFTGAITASAGFSAPPIGLQQLARATATLTKNANTTLGDITGMSFTVGANETWVFHGVVSVLSAAAANFKLGMTGPAAPTSFMLAVTSNGAISNAGVATAFGSGATGSTNGVQAGLAVNGIVRNGANAGTCQLQGAQQTSNASDSVVAVDSFLLAWRIA